jgi:hypothetical protein
MEENAQDGERGEGGTTAFLEGRTLSLRGETGTVAEALELASPVDNGGMGGDAV